MLLESSRRPASPTSASTMRIVSAASHSAWKCLIVGVAFMGISGARLNAAASSQPSITKTVAAVTNTVLELSSGVPVGSGVTVTLTATVSASGAPVSPGFVTFCDATPMFCEDLAVLGSSAVNTGGIATMKKVLAPGTHRISAIFNATVSNARSISAIQSVDVPVQPQSPGQSVTTIFKSSRTNPLPLQATVTGVGTAALGGTVSIVQDQGKHTLATAPVGPSTAGTSFSPVAINEFIEDMGFQLLTGDFNGDGLPDLVSALNFGFGDGTEGLVGISLNDPTHPGQFLPAVIAAPGNGIRNVVVGDFNNDGVLDVVAYVYDDDGSAKSYLLLGDPTHPGHLLYAEILPGTVDYQTAADVNQDGILDLVGSDSTGIDVLFGDPAHPGQFENETTIPGGNGTVAVADVNGDGVPDLIAASTNPQAPGIAVLLGDPGNPGHFLAPSDYPLTGNNGPVQIIIGDFSHDGLPDVAALLPAGDVNILLNNPVSLGHFLTSVDYPFSADTASFTLGDFNGDGALDLAAIDGSARGVTVLSGDPVQPGRFLPAVDYPRFSEGVDPTSLTGADFNSDGLTDLAFFQSPYDYESQFGTLLAQRTQTASVSFPSVTYDSTKSPLAQSVFSGDENYNHSGSCSIDLSGHKAAPVLYDIHVSSVGRTDATIAWYWNGAVAAVDYAQVEGATGTTGWVNVEPSQPNAPSLIKLTGLVPGNEYSYQIRAIDYFSGCTHWTTFSPDDSAESFTTAP